MPPSLGSPRSPGDALSAALVNVVDAARALSVALRGGAAAVELRAALAAAKARLGEQLPARTTSEGARLSANALDAVERALRDSASEVVMTAASTAHLVARSSWGCASQVGLRFAGGAPVRGGFWEAAPVRGGGLGGRRLRVHHSVA
jgi:hypothetical protein